MKTEDAKRGLEAARAKSAELGMRGCSVAIVDAGGTMVVFERVNSSATMTALVSESKAATSALTGMPTKALAGAEERWPTLTGPIAARLNGRFSTWQGGVPVRAGEELIGAVGVSGGSPEQDEEVATAAAEAIVSG